MSFKFINKNLLVLTLLYLCFAQGTSYAQKYKWMSIGSLQDWYSEMGCEREEGVPHPKFAKVDQQTGWQWPADHDLMDCQAWKGLWIGAKNFVDAKGATIPFKVVHSGPRVSGAKEFIPVKFYMKSKFPQPVVTVEGNLSTGLNDAVIDSVDPTMLADREIVNVVSTQLGLTMTRRIFQFSHPYHDNYIVTEYTFTNTGDTDGDPTTIELPNHTLEGVQMFWQYRMAPSFYSRYAIGNSSGWGVNTTVDTRGDGVKSDPENQKFRTQYAWHGLYTDFGTCNNIGGPITTVTTNIAKGDTIWRLAAFQFVGTLTLHADKSATDKTDDLGQPSTTNTFDSDDPLNSGNDAFNLNKMAGEYARMTMGHDTRHLDKIGETNYIMPTKDPKITYPSGASFGNGYGPYTIKPGESVKIVVAQAAAGMGWEAGEAVGKQYKTDKNTLKKNTEVFKGIDSLFTTYRRAANNYNNNWNLQNPPKPPATINVDGLGDRVAISWSLFDEGDPEVQGFQIWRAIGRRDSTYRIMTELPASARSYSDTSAPRGVDCYYRILSVGKPMAANPALNIPATRLVSSKFFGQTYDPATLKRPPTAMKSGDRTKVRVVPNPFSLGASTYLNFPDKRDRIYFYEIPGECTIKIYTEYGELINTIEHLNGSGDQYWDCVTSENQVIVSGIYIAVVTDHATGESRLVKFVVIR